MKKETSILDYTNLLNKPVLIKLSSGKKVEGILKGFDEIGNIVLDSAVEILGESNRSLGVLFARGPNISIVLPKDSVKLTENPFE